MRRRLYAGHIHLGTTCAPYYLEERRRAHPRWVLLGALAPSPHGVGGRALYGSTLMVRDRDGPRDVEGLRGLRFGFNEPLSLSGHLAVHLWLAESGEARDFFGEAVETGGHRASLRALRAGEVDVVALDSTVEAHLRRHRPDGLAGLRALLALGPHPHPPLVAHHTLGPELLAALRATLPTLHESPALAPLLASYDFDRLVVMDDADLDELAERLKGAHGVRLAPRTRDLRGI